MGNEREKKVEVGRKGKVEIFLTPQLFKRVVVCQDIG